MLEASNNHEIQIDGLKVEKAYREGSNDNSIQSLETAMTGHGETLYRMRNNGVQDISETNKEDAKNTNGIYLIILASLPWLFLQIARFCQGQVIKKNILFLGHGAILSKFIWIFNPIIELICSPFAGYFYDKLKVCQRDRKSLVFFAIGSNTLALVGFTISPLLGSNVGSVGVYITLTILQITMVFVELPLRAIICDAASPHLQIPAQLLVSLFQGVGGIIGSLLMAKVFTQGYGIIPLLLISTTLNLFIFIIFFAFLKLSSPLFRNDGEKGYFDNIVKAIWSTASKTDREIMMVYLVEFCSWFGLFSWTLTVPKWFDCPLDSTGLDDDIHESCLAIGSGSLLYDSGLNSYKASLNSAYISQVLFSFIFFFLFTLKPVLLHKSRFVFALGLFLGALFFILAQSGYFSIVSSVFSAIVTGVCVGCATSVVQSFPYAYIGKHGIKHNQQELNGLKIGYLNIFITVPKLIVTLGPNFSGLLSSAVFLTLACFVSLYMKERLSEIDTRPEHLQMTRPPSHLAF